MTEEGGKEAGVEEADAAAADVGRGIVAASVDMSGPAAFDGRSALGLASGLKSFPSVGSMGAPNGSVASMAANWTADDTTTHDEDQVVLCGLNIRVRVCVADGKNGDGNDHEHRLEGDQHSSQSPFPANATAHSVRPVPVTRM